MKRIPHLRYFWEDCNQNVIVANVRTNEARRMFFHSKNSSETYFKSQFWIKSSEDEGTDITKITRSQARNFLKTGVRSFPAKLAHL